MAKLFPLMLVLALSLGGCGPIVAGELGSLTVQMRTPENARVPGVAFEIVREGDTLVGSFDVSDRGEFVYVGFPPGVYQMSVRQPPSGYAVSPTQENPVRVTVTEGKETTVRFILIRQ